MLWALAPLLLGIPSAPCFGWAAWRGRDKALAIEATCYGLATVGFFALSSQSGSANSAAGGLVLALMGVATTRALLIRRHVFFPTTHPKVPAQIPPDWTPAFPASQAGPVDPRVPATWANPFACTGYDGHLLSLPLSRTAFIAVGGALLVAGDIRFHVLNSGLGYGIGLLLAPLVAAMFSRRVEGPTLSYRSWGIKHAVGLLEVTAVDTLKGSPTSSVLVLTTHDRDRSVRVALSTRGYAVPPSARDHLVGWLNRPGVLITPAADHVLRTGLSAVAGARVGRQRRVLLVAISCLVAAAVGASVLIELPSASLAIPGAPGYFTATGPLGRPFPVGRPWGQGCEPLRFEVGSGVPTGVYQQLATVVGEGRQDGLNITVGNRSAEPDPASLTYPPGLSASEVPVVGIFANTTARPVSSSGHPEHVNIGWNAKPDADGRHEDVTYVDATLYLANLPNAAAERTALRQTLAFTQGVSSTDLGDSGIREGATRDSFSSSDVHAMKVMSGCPAP